MGRDSNLRDIADVPAIDVWGETVQARGIIGQNASLAVVELGPNAIVPEHPDATEEPVSFVKRVGAAVARELAILTEEPAEDRYRRRIERYRKLGVPS